VAYASRLLGDAETRYGYNEKLCLSLCDRTTLGRGFTDQDHLKRFSVKREHNQHT
jgi:hypothetical protein